MNKSPLRRGGLVINRLTKSGAEGQRRIDTGLPRLVFEFVAVHTNRLSCPHYFNQSWLGCTNALIMSPGPSRPFVHGFLHELAVLFSGTGLAISLANLTQSRTCFREIFTVQHWSNHDISTKGEEPWFDNSW